MKRLAWATFAVAALLGLVNIGQTGEEKDLRAFIDKAIAAQGGEAALSKFTGVTMKGDGKFHGLGEAVDYTIEVSTLIEKKLRVAMDLRVMNLDLKINIAVNGEKGWLKINDDVKEMPADELAETKAQMECGAAIRLLPLKDKSYKLASLGDVKVGDQKAIGIRVTKEGRRDVNLYFDKDGLLLKSEFMVKDIKASGDKEIAQTNLYSDYKDFQGTRQPTRVVVERDGKVFTETRVTEIQLLEKIDDAVFERP